MIEDIEKKVTLTCERYARYLTHTRNTPAQINFTPSTLVTVHYTIPDATVKHFSTA